MATATATVPAWPAITITTSNNILALEFATHWKAEEEKVKASEEYQEAVAAGTPLPKVHFYNVLKRQFMRQMVIAGIFKFFNDVSQVTIRA